MIKANEAISGGQIRFQEIAALPNLKDICTYLIKKFKSVVECKHMVLLIFSNNKLEVAPNGTDKTILENEKNGFSKS